MQQPWDPAGWPLPDADPAQQAQLDAALHQQPATWSQQHHQHPWQQQKQQQQQQQSSALPDASSWRPPPQQQQQQQQQQQSSGEAGNAGWTQQQAQQWWQWYGSSPLQPAQVISSCVPSKPAGCAHACVQPRRLQTWLSTSELHPDFYFPIADELLRAAQQQHTSCVRAGEYVSGPICSSISSTSGIAAWC